MDNKRTIFSFFGNIKDIATISVLIVLAIIFTRFTSFMFGPVRIDPAGTAIIIFSGMAFGPIAGALVGFLSDILGFIVFNPTPYVWMPWILAGQVAYGFVGGAFFWFIRNKVVEKIPPSFKQYLVYSVTTILSTFSGFLLVTIGLTYLMLEKTFLELFMVRIVAQPFYWIWYSFITSSLMVAYLALYNRREE